MRTDMIFNLMVPDTQLLPTLRDPCILRFVGRRQAVHHNGELNLARGREFIYSTAITRGEDSSYDVGKNKEFNLIFGIFVRFSVFCIENKQVLIIHKQKNNKNDS
jgi:hypothetical protein